MLEADWREYRRNLPHLRMRGATYFLTWRLHSNQPELTAAERDLVVESLTKLAGVHYDLLAFVVMNDHVHVLVTPREDRRLESIVQPWKSVTSHAMVKKGRTAPVWMHESFDRIVRDQSELEQKANYILNNPLKRWPEIREYRWLQCAIAMGEATRDGEGISGEAPEATGGEGER
jgi:REP element-mobilizing transposase RayT